MSQIHRLAGISALVLVVACVEKAASQTIDDQGLWTALFAQGNVGQQDHSRLKWWFDGHVRLLDDADGFNQSIVRPGIGWAVSKNSALWAGYGWIRTSPLRGSDIDEHRIWQQWTWSRACTPMKFALRSRFEQRLVETGDDTGLRFRQLIRAQRSLPGRLPLTAVCWDELFVNLNDTDWGASSGIDQNRVFVGIGIQRTGLGRWRTEIGYLNQSINLDGRANRSHHILSINFFRSPS